MGHGHGALEPLACCATAPLCRRRAPGGTHGQRYIKYVVPWFPGSRWLVRSKSSTNTNTVIGAKCIGGWIHTGLLIGYWGPGPGTGLRSSAVWSVGVGETSYLARK